MKDQNIYMCKLVHIVWNNRIKIILLTMLNFKLMKTGTADVTTTTMSQTNTKINSVPKLMKIIYINKIPVFLFYVVRAILPNGSQTIWPAINRSLYGLSIHFVMCLLYPMF